MKRITGIVLRVRRSWVNSQGKDACTVREACPIEAGDDHALRVEWINTTASAPLMYLNFQLWLPVGMTLTFVDDSTKYKDFSSTSRIKSWRKVQNTIRKKLYQDAEENRVRKERTHTLDFQSKGIGDRFKWLVRNEDIYHPTMGEIVEKYFHHTCAVCITPNSWFDKQLQEAYYARRKKTKKECTNERKDTTK